MLCKFTANCTIGGGRKRRICAICTSALLSALIIAFAALALPIRASAEPIVYTDGGITYTLTENGDNTYKMTVSGSGGMEDFAPQFNFSDYTVTITSPYDSYSQNITEVVIESDITHVGEYAFYDFKSLAAVSIPTTVKTIGDSAFSGCGLASVTIPEGVETINDNAFESCRALTSINLPSTLKSIGNNAFLQCTALASIEIPEGVLTIDIGAFAQCSSLASVTLPSTLTSIGNGTFAQCFALDRIIYKDGVTLGENAVTDTATQVKYTRDGSAVTITNIILGTGKTAVEIPQTVNGITVAPITDQELMKKVAHTHTGGAATCTQKAVCTLCGLEYGELLPHTGGTASCTAKAVCGVCGNEYGELAAHNFVNGVCTVCNAADPNYTQPDETTVTEDTTETEPTETAPEGTESAETTPTETEPTGTVPTSPTGTAPSVPSRPSAPAPAPAVTTAVTTVTTVTTAATTTAEEEIIGEDYTGEDVSVDAAVRAEEKEIGGRAFGAALVYITIFAGLAIAVKKLRPEK